MHYVTISHGWVIRDVMISISPGWRGSWRSTTRAAWTTCTASPASWAPSSASSWPRQSTKTSTTETKSIKLHSLFLHKYCSKFCYDYSLAKVYPALVDHEDHGEMVAAITPGQQALNQLYAGLVTMAFALVGGAITGMILNILIGS